MWNRIKVFAASRLRLVVLVGLVAVLGLAWLAAKPAALHLIDGYQRWISPHKGYQCAFKQYHGGLSCSEYGEKVIAENGVFTGLLFLNARFDECSQARAHLVREQCPLQGVDVSQAGCLEDSGGVCGWLSGKFCQGFSCGFCASCGSGGDG
jgi:putative component of membrane protein insertase Oxa1/YidC/SpoIIIJ protein YidD